MATLRALRIAIVTAGGAGLLPKAPGTFGSVVGLLLVVILPAEGFALWSAGLVITTSFLCVLLGGSAERDFNDKDPQAFVLDEVAGMALSAAAATKPGLHWCIAAFALFRFFDIKKPLGIAKLQRFHGGTGILLDDLAAGLCAFAIIQTARFITNPSISN